ncbi:Signal transducer and activator of transcription b [Toxocara canis]|uniref:Signal transducer and activator of transcription b n=1 Tax=Toxocara canis TaxID=6265 RepID=A0A0B2VFQ9_TOXCA|nr:Signal transducer and activator of transcription b [Toxocara canis]
MDYMEAIADPPASFSNVGSPEAPNVDSQFVTKHNISAEIYQLFKDDVDMLLSGKVPQNDQPELISRIINCSTELYTALDEEKQYLMGDVLYSWAVRQQKVSIGTLWSQQAHYRLLDTIHQQFEYFGELLEQTMSGIRYIQDRYRHEAFDTVYLKLQQLAHYFLYYSIIVSRQPPSVVVKCGEAENHRRSRFWFNTEIRFEYFGELLEQTMSGIRYIQDRYRHEAFDTVYLKLQQLAHYFLYYSIIVSRQPPSVVVKCGEAENHRRSRFWFNTEIRVLGGRAFGVDQEGDGVEVNCFLITDETAKQLLSNAYHDVFENEEFVIEPPSATFQRKEGRGIKAKFDDMRVAKKGQLRRDSVATKRYCLCYSINLKASHGITLIGKKVSLPFAILVGPKTDVEARLFLERSFADLVRRPLSDIPTSVDYREMADALEMKFQAIVETPQKSTDGPSIVQPRMFTDQEKEHVIMRLKPDTNGQVNLENFLKRLKFKISVLQHHWYDHTDLNARSLQKELLSNHKFSDIELIYPDINLEAALGSRQKRHGNRKPRILNPTPVYFDNQGAATSAF